MNKRCTRNRLAAATILIAGWLVVSAGCQESPSPGAAKSEPSPVIAAGPPAVSPPSEPAREPAGVSPDEPKRPSLDASAAPTEVQPPAATPTSTPTSTPDGTAAIRPVAATGTLDLSFDDVKFPMEKTDDFDRSMLTDTIESYAGRTIRIRGFILPSFKQDGITQFVLVRDNMECCFGPGAALFDCIMVRMVPGKTASFSIRPVTVEGKFSIDEWKDFDDVVRAIYQLQATAVY